MGFVFKGGEGQKCTVGTSTTTTSIQLPTRIKCCAFLNKERIYSGTRPSPEKIDKSTISKILFLVNPSSSLKKTCQNSK